MNGPRGTSPRGSSVIQFQKATWHLVTRILDDSVATGPRGICHMDPQCFSFKCPRGSSPRGSSVVQCQRRGARGISPGRSSAGRVSQRPRGIPPRGSSVIRVQKGRGARGISPRGPSKLEFQRGKPCGISPRGSSVLQFKGQHGISPSGSSVIQLQGPTWRPATRSVSDSVAKAHVASRQHCRGR